MLVNNKVIENATTEIPIDCKLTVSNGSVWCELVVKFNRMTEKEDLQDEVLKLNEMPGFKLEWDVVDNYTKDKEAVQTDFSR